MASAYRISDAAASDLGEIWRYIGSRDSDTADAVIDACFDAFEALSTCPSRRPRLPTPLRGSVVDAYSKVIAVADVAAKPVALAPSG